MASITLGTAAGQVEEVGFAAGPGYKAHMRLCSQQVALAALYGEKIQGEPLANAPRALREGSHPHGYSAEWGEGSMGLVWGGKAGVAGELCWQLGEQEKGAGAGAGWSGFGHSPASPTGHPPFLSAVVRCVTTRDLYPEFGLDMSD